MGKRLTNDETAGAYCNKPLHRTWIFVVLKTLNTNKKEVTK
jgi:hypothetical protein